MTLPNSLGMFMYRSFTIPDLKSTPEQWELVIRYTESSPI